MTLPFDQWEKVLSIDVPVSELHVPYGSPITKNSVDISLRTSIAFFEEHFPTANPKAFVSGSWMFSPILESLIGANSNAGNLQKELYLVSGTTGYGGFSFIFPEDRFSLETATGDTRLQRAITDLLNSGGKWRIGEMFFLADDLDKFGTQHYTRSYERVMETIYRL